MELDVTTFLLEIVNVLVLIWLLKRFFYRPVMTVIADRQAAIAKTVAEASRLQADAGALKEQYDRRLDGWEQERERARAELQEEMTAERQRRLASLQADLDRERQQASVRENQRIKDVARQAETLALLQGAQFTTALLSRVAGPELEHKLIDAMLEDWSKLPQHQVDAVRSALPEKARGKLTTAYLLEPDSRAALVKKVEDRLGQAFEWDFIEDRTLLAGLRVSLGGWVLRGNLQDELKFFAESETGGS